MIEYPLDDGGVLDARNDPEPAATAPAPFNLDRKDPLEALGLRLIARCRAPAVLSGDRLASAFVLGTTRTRWGLAGANTP
jgi:hypothetical protein